MADAPYTGNHLYFVAGNLTTESVSSLWYAEYGAT